MPEWPDLHVLRERLERALAGREIVGVHLGDPVVVRAVRPLEELLVGREFGEIRHRGKFLVLELGWARAAPGRGHPIRMVVAPMLSGLFELRRSTSRVSADTRLRIGLDPDPRDADAPDELRYRDDTRMGKVYVIEDEDRVPGFRGQGPEAGTLEWSEADFSKQARARRSEARNLLMDQTFVAGIGNAYADEIMWDARIHPKRRVATLSPDELSALYASLRDVLAAGVEAVVAGLPAELGTKVRGHMKVRGRAGEPCPRCGTSIVRTRSGMDETYLCPRCQPAPKGFIR